MQERNPGELFVYWIRARGQFLWKIEWGVFGRGVFQITDLIVLKPDVAIASEVSILRKKSLAITDFDPDVMQSGFGSGEF